MKKYIFLAILIILGAGGYTAYLSFEGTVKKAVNHYGSQVTGTQVELGGISFSPLKGELILTNLTVANPKNYSKPYLMSLGKIGVAVDIKSLFSDTIVVKSIDIQNPAITYEMMTLTKNNISQLMTNISKNSASAEKKQPAAAKTTEKKVEPKASSSSKKVVIDSLVISGGKIELAANIAGQAASASVDLPAIEMKDIGKNKKMSIVETISLVMNKILNTSYESVVNSNAANIENIAKDTINKVLENATEGKKIKEGLKDLLSF